MQPRNTGRQLANRFMMQSKDANGQWEAVLSRSFQRAVRDAERETASNQFATGLFIRCKAMVGPLKERQRMRWMSVLGISMRFYWDRKNRLSWNGRPATSLLLIAQ